MTLLHWRDNMSVGVDALDDDHKKLVDLLNRLHYLNLAGADHGSVAEVLEELMHYTEYHFDREEKLMQFSDYPELDEHRDCHRKLTRQLLEYKQTFEDRPDRFDVKEFYDFVSEWLLVHVLEDDMKYKPYLRSEESSKAE
jgi:hemerythrin